MELLENSATPQANGEESTLDRQDNQIVSDNEMKDENVTKDDILRRLAAIAELPAQDIEADEVARLKQQFYLIHNEEVRVAREEFVAAGNDAAAFEAPVDEAEERMKESLNLIKEKKAALRAEQEAERARNYDRKRAIIDELIAMSADADNVNRHYQRTKDLQVEFKSIGEVSPTVAATVWKDYQDAVERFYDQWKVNKELRDYDFKKNLSEKQLLVTEAEKLVEEPDVIVAFRRLQELHEKWREIGPVSKEVREEIWNRFKDASAQINKRYQTYFEDRKARERQNEDAKTALCERIEAIDMDSLHSYSAWDEQTKVIIGAQEDWKKLGFASKKANNELFARFRATCDAFFARKAEFFKKMKDDLSENLARKTALCERAEALKDSTDWKKTTDELVALQKEWKTIGAVAKKHSDAVWRRFLAACDYFFDQKKKNTSGLRKAEQANLKAKQEIIARLTQLNSADDTTPRDEAVKEVQQLRARWQETGHVPFREKDRVYEAYRKVLGEVYDKLDVRETRARMANFETSIASIEGDENKLYRERERLARACEQRRSELHTYENNLGFFNSKSKSGDSMLREMERKIQRLKDDIADLEKKLRLIDSKL